MRLIDADKLKDEVLKQGATYILTLIDNAPTVEAFTKDEYEGAYLRGYVDSAKANERPTGKWLIEGGTTLHFCCSECGCAGDNWDKFCKHCGAKMEAMKE